MTIVIVIVIIVIVTTIFIVVVTIVTCLITLKVPVPREIVGFVIGKGGDTIKRIQAETGCRVQFTMRKLLFLLCHVAIFSCCNFFMLPFTFSIVLSNESIKRSFLLS